ncbi:DNA adenine methylase [Rickettsia endosymbiont of Orchestes rusci]|uniref:DNA adenine methylase n=1 Tax=Rickettsia endosymbiont of Orchestes rusci TaxID=3066250 RepID=UPI00313DCDCD
MLETKIIGKPFFRWVGGKRKLIAPLLAYIPSGFDNYYEPFLGGGALFFAVKDKFKKCFLSDINFDLITSYNAVKKNPNEVVKLYDMHIQNHSKDYYRKIVNYCTNNPNAIAARFLYLNKYSFKGVYQFNKQGKLRSTFFDTKYKNLNIEEKLKEYSSFLNDVFIYTIDFSFIEPQKNDFVYFDPPYHQTGEIFYTKLPFSENDQIRLRDFAVELDSKNIKFMISNNDTSFIRKLYENFNIKNIEIKYSITNHTKSSTEIIVTNY